MNTHGFDIDDQALDDALRALDVADHELAPAAQARRQDLLRHLLASSGAGGAVSAGGLKGADRAGAPAGSASRPARLERSGVCRGSQGVPADAVPQTGAVAPLTAVPLTAGRRRRPAVRWILPAAAAVALVGTLVVVGQPGEKHAYASWTADPTPVTGESLSRAEGACRAGMTDSTTRHADIPPELRPIVRPDEMRSVVAERRGDYLFLAMADDRGSTQQCFFDAGDLARPKGITGGWATASTPPPTALGADELEDSGGGAASGPEGSYVFAVGRVGKDVTGVTVNADGRAVRATITDGHFAAWWPDEVAQPDTVGPAIAYEVTLRDGTVRRRLGDAPGVPPVQAPGPRAIGRVERGGGVGENGPVATAAGRVGSEVVGVSLVIGGETVQATVTDGTFSAQWPSPGSEEKRAITYDLTLRDGSVLAGQQPQEG